MVKLHKSFNRNYRNRKIVQAFAGDMQNVAGMSNFIDDGLAAVV